MAASVEQPLRVLELYSGIGGMHWALKTSGVPYEVVLAVDINTTANKIYQHNFPHVNLLSFGIEKLSLQKLESLEIDAILMSPPCQPFTRVGKQRDCNDVRTRSFLHLLQLIEQMTRKPTYIVIENVKGFETSQTRELLLDCLASSGYNHQEFLLTPLQFGIPNCRLRYYLLARWNKSFNFCVTSQILTELPPVNPNNRAACRCEGKSDVEDRLGHSHCSHAQRVDIQNNPTPSSSAGLDTLDGRLKPDPDHGGQEVRLEVQGAQLQEAGRNLRYCEEQEKFVNEQSKSLSEFMEEAESEKDLDHYLLSDKELRFFVVMDVVLPALKKSICFTKRYGHYVDGAGSVMQMSTDVQVTREASELKSQAVTLHNSHDWQEKELSLLRKLKLRYFTPSEVANLLCFPSDFAFPEGLSTVQKYRVLGNSLNVLVVAELIKLMVSPY